MTYHTNKNFEKNYLIIISSKSPNPLLKKCIESLYKYQIKQSSNYKIIVIDSDSQNKDYYNEIEKLYSDVEIHYCQNKNYEYGAWKYGYEKYPNYDIYICIQDSLELYKSIDINIINNNNAYIFYHHSGYIAHLEIKNLGIEYLRDTNFDYKSIIDTDFNLAQHNSFIVSNDVMKDLFKTFTKPPINKDGSCVYERNFGIYFIKKSFQTMNLYDYFTKINGKRI